MILVEFVVAFAFFVFIGIFYKKITGVVCLYLDKYSADIEKKITDKNRLYDQAHQELSKMQDNNFQFDMQKIIDERKKNINEIVHFYEKKQQKYEEQINERINSIKNCIHTTKYTSIHKDYIKSMCKVKINDVLLKFANLYKNRHTK